MAIENTPRLGLETYTAGTDPHPNRDKFNARMKQLDDKTVLYGQSTTVNRPPAGTKGVLFWDESSKRLYWDNGVGWEDTNPNGGGGAGKPIVPGAAAIEGLSNRAARADHTHHLPLATSTVHGAMSSTDKAKLDKLEPAGIFRSLVMKGSMNLAHGTYMTLWNLEAHTSDRPGGIDFNGGVGTIRVAGLYEMDGQCTFEGGEGGLRAVNFVIDGVHYHRTYGQGVGASSLSVRNHFFHYLTPGHTVEFQAYQSTGKTMTLPFTGDGTRWTIRKVSE